MANTYETEWDAAVNARIALIDSKIASIQERKDTVDARLAKIAGSDNADVVVLRGQLTKQSERLGSQITVKETEKTAFQARLFASLTDEQKAVLVAVGDGLPAEVLVMLASSQADIVEFFTRGMAGRESLADTDVLTDQDDIDICKTLIQLMLQGQ